MKICCDVCNKEEASVFCAADEAALCVTCDQRVHHANKLAGKHVRFSLLNPSIKESPLCDICQERRAFLFCKEDRAILCRECDIPIHKTNQHTQNHNRFLLTGVKLSPLSSSSSSSCHASSSSNGSEIKSCCPNEFSPYHTMSSNINDQNQYSTTSENVQYQSSMSTSSISEYLIEALPGWQVDEFLGPSSHGFCKDHDVQYPISDQVFQNEFYPSLGNMSGIWVPQAPPQPSEYEEHKMPKFSRNCHEDGLKVSKTSRSQKKSRNFC